MTRKYIYDPPTPTKGTWKESDILVLFHYIAFIIWELPSINFGIGGVVADTTSGHLKDYPASSGRVQYDWRIYTSSLCIFLLQVLNS